MVVLTEFQVLKWIIMFYVKVHLTPKMFLIVDKEACFVENVFEKNFEFGWILDFIRFFELWKMLPKKGYFGSSQSENLFLENGASDVSSRTDFPTITVKSTHFLQPADLFSLFIDCGGRKCRRFSLLLVAATRKTKPKVYRCMWYTHTMTFVANNTWTQPYHSLTTTVPSNRSFNCFSSS